MSVIEISDDAAFGDKLSEAGSRLVVCDFFATWCGPCNMIAPFFKQLATKYPNAMFIKIDVDKCQGTAMANNVSAMPTFVFMRNRSELDRIRGADRNQLENKVKQYYSSTDGASTSAGAAGGEAGAAAGPALEGEFVINNDPYLYYLYYYSFSRFRRFTVKLLLTLIQLTLGN